MLFSAIADKLKGSRLAVSSKRTARRLRLIRPLVASSSLAVPLPLFVGRALGATKVFFGRADK